MRILGRISLFGSKVAIEAIASVIPHVLGSVAQVGHKRKNPDTDYWAWESETYRFDVENLDEQLRSFVSQCAALKKPLETNRAGVRYAYLTLCPVDQTPDELFHCVLNSATVQAIGDLGIGVQVAPATAMPDAPAWKSARP